MFMVTMPPEVTASSGIDTVSHSIEAFTSTEASPLTDSLALASIKLAFGYLPRAYENGNDLKAREQMMYASVMAGMAFTNAGLGYVHAMTHQLGGFYNQLHGDYNGILLPYILEFNSVGVPENRMLQLAEAVGEKADSKAEAVEKISNALKKLCSDIKIPDGLKKMGVQENDIDMLAQNTLKDIGGFTNPRQVTLEEMKNLYHTAM
jgi:alcohol dehydrogenase